MTDKHWIQTYTGRQFWPFSPRVADVDIRDIAHSLSLQCRFNGHCLRFYSVAEHCVRVSNILSNDAAMWGLLHDAGEAYLSDLPRPIKSLFPNFEPIEQQLLCVIAEALCLQMPLSESVWQADDVLLATEARDLMAAPPESWLLRAQPLPQRIEPMSAEQAERAFLARYEQLKPSAEAFAASASRGASES